jgi:hypothetical protein
VLLAVAQLPGNGMDFFSVFEYGNAERGMGTSATICNARTVTVNL